MTDELKACPFCGGGGAGYIDDVQYPDTPHERVWYAVTCGKCDANGAGDLGKSGAVEKWNTRRLEDALRARIAELEERLRITLKIASCDHEIEHVYQGMCPDYSQPGERDTECPACRAMIEAARVLPMPPAPEGDA